MNILLIGNGKMSKVLKAELKLKNHTIVDTLYEKHKTYNKNIPIDAIIDFSHPKAINLSLKYALLYKVPLIIGTTGYNLDEYNRIKNAAKKIPICLDSNYSIVFNKFYNVKKYLSQDKSYINEYIIEAHHQNKVDIPSGSALKINDNNSKIYSLRGGAIYGEHEVRFLYENEQIIIKHISSNRSIYASGVIHVLNNIIGRKNGFYTLSNFLGESK